jgi:hypothetical protein
MQLHEVIMRHTQVVKALLWVAQIEVHPLLPHHLREGLTTRAALTTASLYLASAIAVAAKLKMGSPSLELSLLLESSVLLIYKNKWVRYKRYLVVTIYGIDPTNISDYCTLIYQKYNNRVLSCC